MRVLKKILFFFQVHISHRHTAFYLIHFKAVLTEKFQCFLFFFAYTFCLTNQFSQYKKIVTNTELERSGELFSFSILGDESSAVQPPPVLVLNWSRMPCF